MKTIPRILLIAILLGVAGGTAYWWFVLKPRGLADGQIRVSGNIETTEAQVAFKIPGRVLNRFVDEGWVVEEGKVVARLETADLECNIALRRAELGVAEAALAALLAGSRPQEIEEARAAYEKASHVQADLEAGSRPQEIEAAKAAVAAAAADMIRTQADFRRAKVLFESKTISAEDFDSTKAACDVALEKHKQAAEQLKLVEEGFRKQRIDEARSAAAQAKAQYDLVKEGPRQEDIDQGRARVDQARAALKQAEIQLSYATIVVPNLNVAAISEDIQSNKNVVLPKNTAPGKYVVLSKNIEQGEYVAPGTAVVTVGDLENVWLRAYIEEEDFGRVHVGQTAWVTTDSFKDKTRDRYRGVVAFIAKEAEFTPKNVQTQKERVKLVYRIKINIKNEGMELKPGMPADAVIETAP